MPCVDYGRAYKKYYEPSVLSIDLQTVTTQDSTTTHDIEVNGSVTTDGFFIGDGSFITNVPSNPGVPDLQTVTGYDPSTSDKVSFSDVYADGNVVINGNVACSELIGNGEFLDGVANAYEISVLDSKITATESNIIITNTSGLTDVTKGDLLVSTNDGVLDKLSIGTTNQVLFANTTTEQPEWEDMGNFTSALNNRTLSLINDPIFSNTNNLTSMNTGDILYGYGTDDLRRLAPQTTADNTFLTTGDYGTGFGRLLRMDEHGENMMWLHPTSNLDYKYISGQSGVMSYIPLFDDELNYGVHLKIKNRPADPIINITDRIEIDSNYFDIKFGRGMFYDQAGVRYKDTNGYSGNGSTWHPDDVKFHWYVQGNIKISGSYHGDGSLLFTGSASIPSVTIFSPFAPLNTFGKDGELLTYSNGYFLGYSDRRLKTKIETISNALDKLAKLTPKLYDKEGKRGTGLIAQDVYYNAKELRHIVWPDRDAKPNDDAPEPDYSDWGKRPACIRYPHLVAYVVKSIHELRERIETLKNNKV